MKVRANGRLAIGLVLFLLLASVASAQTTVVGTVIDPNQNPYSNGTASAIQVVVSGQNPGSPTNVSTDNSGSFSMSLPSNTYYVFTICAPPTQLGPTSNPTPKMVCFQSGPIYVSGVSQDVSSSLNSVAAILGPNLAASVTTIANAINAPGPCPTSAPCQIGPYWYVSSANGLCTPPAAPTVATETISSGTGNFTSAQTYYVEVRLGNMNGWTPPSPPTSYTPASGSTNRMLVQLSDWSYRSGCYKYQVQVSTSGSGGPYYPAQAWTLPSASIASWSCNAAKLCTVITSPAHPFIPGEYITISGAATGTNSTSINGSWTLVGQQTSTPFTLFFFRGTSTVDSSAVASGTAVAQAGLGSDTYSHLVPGDFIVDTVPLSGASFPNTNTAVIDPDQVALNATCNYSNNTCTGGALQYPQSNPIGSYITGTTPLIISNQQTVLGINSALGTYKSVRTCNWADPNIACVMFLGPANGVRFEGLDIRANNGHGLEFFGAGPGYGSSNDFIRNNNISTGDLTGKYSAIYIHGGVWYNMYFENNFLNGGLSDVQIDALSGGWLFFSGSRWNAANLQPYGLSSQAMLAQSSISDPDRGIIRAGFNSGASTVEISNIVEESGSGVIFDVPNIGLGLSNVTAADSSAMAGTPALIRVGTDANTTSSGWNFHIENSIINAVSGVPTGLQVVTNTGTSNIGYIYVSHSTLGGNPNEIDLNGSGAGYICVNGSICNSYPAATGHKVINPGVSNPGTGIAAGQIGSNAGEYAYNQLTMGTRFTYKGGTDGFYFWPSSTADWWWYGGDPAVSTNRGMDWSWNSGFRMRIWQNDGATPLVDFWTQGQNEINFCNPSSPSANRININCDIVGKNAPIQASLTTTASTSDNVTVTGMTASGHCQITATNASGATNIATTYVSNKTTNQITVTHTATSGMTYDIMCTAD